MNEENKKCQVWINDDDPEMFELRILIKLCRSEGTARRDLVISSVITILTVQGGSIWDPVLGHRFFKIINEIIHQ